jgi:hypothetical protein
VVAAVVVMLAFGLVYLFVPELRQRFITEDDVLENVTAALLFVGFLLGLGLVLVARRRQTNYSKAQFAVPLLCVLGFLDEISFGERIFDLEMPYVYSVKLDAIHDVAMIMYRVLEDHVGFGMTVGMLAAFILVLVAIAAMYRRRFTPITETMRRYPTLVFVLLSITFAVCALMLDLVLDSVGGPRFVIFIEEMLELNAALALLFAALSISPAKAQRISSY